MHLTIIIPTRNRNGRVVECVHALEHHQADIVVIDDASEEPVELPSNRARVIRHNRPRGRGASINTALEAAIHDLVLIIDDDVYAAPDMAVRLFDEFSAQKNPKLGLAARVTWDPDAPLTLTMKWMEHAHKLASPVLLSRSLILESGGYDENFTHRLEDAELRHRLQERGLELQLLESAIGFQNNVLRIRDLVEREFLEGMSAVLLHAKYPHSLPEVEDMGMLLKNEAQASDAAAAVEEIVLIEQSGSAALSESVSDLYGHVCRHYFLHGIFEGLKDIGGMKPRRNSSSTVAIYRHASRLEDMAEFDEARRLFRLVLHRPDEHYWNGAEYHLGRIELALGNPEAAHAHFTECLRLNPRHNEARRALYKPAHYREVASNIFESTEPAGPRSALFILFGDLGHVVNAFPVIAALHKKFDYKTAWLTSPEYAALARASVTRKVFERKSLDLIPWDWIHAQGFTHVFFPEPGANLEEWERSGLDATSFMAQKCAVEIETRRPRIALDVHPISEAEQFMREHGLTRNAFITASYGDGERRHWPKSNLTKLAQQTAVPTVVFGKKGDPQIPGTVACLDKPLEVIAALMEWSCFYLGPAHGTAWLATATDTPMGVFFDPQEPACRLGSPAESLRGEKDDIEEWSIYTNFSTVLDHIESAVIARMCSHGL